jgi:TolA-binding protein|tara:strand:- start:233 stop:421 length:189 start_codon:yes stop_codon:yes gene_type:complete
MSKQNKTETAISELMKKLTSLKGQVDMLEHINEILMENIDYEKYAEIEDRIQNIITTFNGGK